MRPQTVTFAVIRNKGSITIGKGSIFQPKTRFTGGSIKWHQDKPKQKDD